MAAGQAMALCGQDIVSNVSRLLTFLMTLQSAALNSSTNTSSFDPKTYVDLPLRYSLSETERVFSSLPTVGGVIPNDTLQKFVDDYFNPPGSELVESRPSDFVPKPSGFLPKVRNDQVRNWAHQVHNIWKNLSRTENASVAMNPELYTVVSLNNLFVIPGSRFREVYYWDTYWVVRGLVVSKMFDTAKGAVENLLSFVDAYGFVPNGARKYYLNRSQPPLLSEMVKTVFESTGELAGLHKALPILIKEHSFWTKAPHLVNFVDGNGTVHSLSRYYANWNSPRPESYTIDLKVAEGVEESKRPQLYNDIATTAETGWDFSSRWMEDRYNLTTLRTSKIVPADLNAYVFQMEKNIAMFAKLVGDHSVAREFAHKAEARRIAIEAVLWNDRMKQWNDYWLPEDFCQSTATKINKHSCLNQDIYASNFVPLWAGLLFHDDAGHQRAEDLVVALKSSGLLEPAGIATSLKETGQQWDHPNGWAPLQHMIIEGLYSTNCDSAKEMAEDLAVRWLKTNFATFEATGAMHEKYDVRECGFSGGGGEYTAQTGFGWSNGVVLALLDHYGWPADRKISCSIASANGHRPLDRKILCGHLTTNGHL